MAREAPGINAEGDNPQELNLVKPEWGTKRSCPKCGARFYDLKKDAPITCIECGNEWRAEPILKSKQPIPEPEKKKPSKSTAKTDDQTKDKGDSKEEDDDEDEDFDLDIDDDIDEDLEDDDLDEDVPDVLDPALDEDDSTGN